jgi:hypothetical protein
VSKSSQAPRFERGQQWAFAYPPPAANVVAFTDVAPIPGLGFLPVNAYLVQAEQPLLVDSGLPTSRPDFLQTLWSQIEPADLRQSHDDRLLRSAHGNLFHI